MNKFKAYITVYHCIDDIEAPNKEEAREKAATDYIWDDHIKDVIIDVEEDWRMEKENNFYEIWWADGSKRTLLSRLK